MDEQANMKRKAIKQRNTEKIKWNIELEIKHCKKWNIKSIDRLFFPGEGEKGWGTEQYGGHSSERVGLRKENEGDEEREIYGGGKQ